MGKGIYTYYKNRLVEIGGGNKCLYLKKIVRRGAYDIGRIFSTREKKIAELFDSLWNGKRSSFTLLCEDEIDEIAENIGSTEEEAEGEEKKSTKKSKGNDKIKLLEAEVAKIKEIKREIEEIERETGRYELYVGYPFVFGSIPQGSQRSLIKAPLMLFPVRIDIPDDRTVEISLNESEKIQLNRALVLSYAQSKKINIENLEMEFENLSGFKGIKQLTDFLNHAKIKVEYTTSKNIYPYSRFKEPDEDSDLSLRYAAILARFPLSNSIYNDYTLLERKNLTNDAINELLRTTKKSSFKLFDKIHSFKNGLKAKKIGSKKTYTAKGSYTVKMLDYAQSEVVRKVDELGNMVIYGPPGTGKSQTIVNVITDAIVKNKKVLVVSQKKAALDVVYSRLGTLNESAMYINDEAKEKKAFYEKIYALHKRLVHGRKAEIEPRQNEFDELEGKIAEEQQTLEKMYSLLNDKRPFGLSLAEMYSSSYMLEKNSPEHTAYLNMLKCPEVLAMNYKDLSDALFKIKAHNLCDMYYDFAVEKNKNPLIEMMLPDIEIRTLGEVKDLLLKAEKERHGSFNFAKYPHLRQVLAHYTRLNDEKKRKAIVKLEAKLESPNFTSNKKAEEKMSESFDETINAINTYIEKYECLKSIMTDDGYFTVIDNILRGNTSFVKLVFAAIENYLSLRDVTNLFRSMDKNVVSVLDFAFSASKSIDKYKELIDKVMLIRIYHELTIAEEECKESLAMLLDFQNVTARIYKLKESQLSVAAKLCAVKSSGEYRELYSNAENAKDYLYQISKEQKFWSIRKMMEVYGNFIITLFPCWLLSPENVSAILPLTKNMFDVVIFDEASQVFIESTIPTIYRGKNIVVAGDSKQLRPSATFMKRFMGTDPEMLEDYSVQAALEVESLLDLAVARYESANLTYHYRSKHQELIDFSNCAFYSSGLQIAPNISTNKLNRPIERYKVDGRWADRTNPAEAEKIVEILSEIFKNRKNNESVGIITFNIDQQTCIADAIESEARKNKAFGAYIAEEKLRTDGGEDTSLFIKNLENVQGDERDIIIFSIGYAPGENGKIYSNFGSLSTEGGENRLNVAITRAKSKIIVVTSIEPEDLKVENSKNLGPRLLRDYLAYARAVSDNDYDATKAILRGLSPTEKDEKEILTNLPRTEEQIKAGLEKLGYTVHTGLGNENNRISLAVFDEKEDRYLVGVILDVDAFASSSASMERDVYKPKFLEARGWNLMRVWCRDFWISPDKVIKAIASAAEKAKKKA